MLRAGGFYRDYARSVSSRLRLGRLPGGDRPWTGAVQSESLALGRRGRRIVVAKTQSENRALSLRKSGPMLNICVLAISSRHLRRNLRRREGRSEFFSSFSPYPL